MAGALAYTFGIGASRRLGARLASFVALLEVVFAITFAWLLLGETAGLLQAIGGLLVLTGVVVIKRAESAGLPDREPERMPVTV
jgi:drug/metabolite transporter (DMT)-like permease